jgi:hypothetical protein
MNTATPSTWIAFSGSKRVAFGASLDVAAKVKNFVDENNSESVLIFDAISSQPVELDLRGSVATVLKKLTHVAVPEIGKVADTSSTASRPVGRPKLGVVAREITLLPRHWDWLAAQSGGASVALRKLVEYGMQRGKQDDRIRQAQESAYRFMSAVAGNAPNFEEATRNLFAGELEKFRQAIAKWPTDVKTHTLTLVEAAIVEPRA